LGRRNICETVEGRREVKREHGNKIAARLCAAKQVEVAVGM
jgi:hypothetical protein